MLACIYRFFCFAESKEREIPVSEFAAKKLWAKTFLRHCASLFGCFERKNQTPKSARFVEKLVEAPISPSKGSSPHPKLPFTMKSLARAQRFSAGRESLALFTGLANGYSRGLRVCTQCRYKSTGLSKRLLV